MVKETQQQLKYQTYVNRLLWFEYRLLCQFDLETE